MGKVAFTVSDIQDLLRLLREKPEWGEELRRAVLTEELLGLPALVREIASEVRALADAQLRAEERLGRLEAAVEALAEAQRRAEERLGRLEEAQVRAEERLARLEAAVEALAEAQRRAEERLGRLEMAQLRTDERLARLEEAQVRAEERLARLEEAQLRAEERLARLEEAQVRTEERLARLEEAVEALAEAQRRTEEELRELVKQVRQIRETQDRFAQIIGPTVEGRMVASILGWLAQRGYRLLGPIASVPLDGVGEVDGLAPVSLPEGGEAWLLVSVKAKVWPRDISSFAELLRNPAAQAALREQGVTGTVLPLIFAMVMDHRSPAAAAGERLGLVLEAQGEIVAPARWTM